MTATITTEMLDAVAAVGVTKHFIPLFALIRLEQQGDERINGMDITREVAAIRDEVQPRADVRRSIRRFEELGIVTVDRSIGGPSGHDNRLSDWGEHLADAFEWEAIAANIDPDAELPDEFEE